MAVLAVTACQMRGDDRPFTSEVPPPPRMVEVKSEPAAPGQGALRQQSQQQPRQPQQPQVQRQQPPAQAQAKQFTCVIEQARYALGQPLTQSLLEDMRSRTGAQAAHSIAQGDTSLPFATERLLVEVDAQGRVVAARCA